MSELRGGGRVSDDWCPPLWTSFALSLLAGLAAALALGQLDAALTIPALVVGATGAAVVETWRWFE